MTERFAVETHERGFVVVDHRTVPADTVAGFAHDDDYGDDPEYGTDAKSAAEAAAAAFNEVDALNIPGVRI